MGSLQVAGFKYKTVNETTDAESPDIFVDDSFKRTFQFPHARGARELIAIGKEFGSSSTV